MSARLLCPVRGCERPLERGERSATCAQGHHFDRARSGYLNLLQPQDKKAREPGDAKEIVEARGRTIARGGVAPLVAALRVELDRVETPAGSAILDVGCGQGAILAALVTGRACEGYGVDLSAHAIDAAAKAHPEVCFLVANADRRLPFAEGSFRAILSITGPKNAAECRRLLAPDGRVIVVVPDDDDLGEVRAEALGAAPPLGREASAVARFQGELELERSQRAEHRARLEGEALRDVMASAYRGARHRERARIDATAALEVTSSWRILTFRRR